MWRFEVETDFRPGPRDIAQTISAKLKCGDRGCMAAGDAALYSILTSLQFNGPPANFKFAA